MLGYANKRWHSAKETQMHDTDVLVVGAGPTGLTAAASLLSRGFAVTLTDRADDAAHTSRAAAVNARTLEVLDDLDVTRRMLAQGITAPRFSIRDGRRLLMPLDFGVLPGAYPFTLLLPQSDTERLLRERFSELGGSIAQRRELTGFRQDDDGVTAEFGGGDRIRARYLVGADGMRSTVRDGAGIGFHGGQYGETFTLADVRLSGDAPRDEVILFWATEGLTVVAPLPGGTHRIVAPTSDSPESPSAEFVQRLLDRRGAGAMTVTDVAWGSRFRIHHRVADTYRAGRVLLAGDAAHVHSPAGGQGMNLGIQDAVSLATALTAVLGGADDALLDAYSDARRPIAQQVVRLTDRLTRLATLPRAARPVRNAAIGAAGRLPAVRRALAYRLSGLVYR
jgi:2-polyprenyl-6-methoxyphenol hydroxylase-like FAD-dependent oxidoreductase